MNTNDATIACPQCKHEFKLNDTLAAPLLEATRKEFERKLAAKETEYHQREQTLHQLQADLAVKEQGIQDQVTTLLKKERDAISKAEAKKATERLQLEMDEQKRQLIDAQDLLKQRDAKLADAVKAQAELVRMKREVEDAKREMDLTVEKRVTESLAAIREQAKRQAEDELNLKVKEKELQIKEMQNKIEELKRKAEQGSQQTQGEVLELALEEQLRSRFPHDVVEAVPKGEFGGDVLHKVYNGHLQCCGSILWESKRTQRWSDGWLTKLRDDQRCAKAELAVIVTQVLPKGVETFDYLEGVWVTSPRTLVPVTIALRQSLIELAAARQANEGLQTKMGLVYQYLMGTQFRQRMQAIVEGFTSMHEDLLKEQKSIKKHWAYREKQLQQVLEATTGVSGDLQGIAGKNVLELKEAEILVIEDWSDGTREGPETQSQGRNP